MPPAATLHPKADWNAAKYDTHRPTYIPAAVDGFLSALGLQGKRGAKILEIGAGTGKFTEILAGRDERFEIVAVEPHPEMVQVLETKNLPGVQVVRTDVYSLPGQMDWADAVIVAQAFHWFANQDALKQIYSHLKNAGKLGFIWNIEDYNQTRTAETHTEWEGKLRDAMWEYEDGAARFKNDLWRKPFENQSWFGPLEETSVGVTIYLDKERLWQRMGTMSYISHLDDKTKQDFYQKFEKILASATDLVRNDRGEIQVHYDVISAVAKKI